MKEGKKIQSSFLRYQMFIHPAMALIKKESYLLLQAEELAKITDFSKKINKKYLVSVISRNTSK